MRGYQSSKLCVVFVFLLFAFNFLISNAEEKTASSVDSLAKTEEGVSSAPDTVDLLKMAMEDFHELLATLWHEAFPENDFKTIREKTPLLQEKLMKLARVKLPDYLKEDIKKLESFLLKRQDLIVSVDQVVLAAADTVDSSLASAFEKMHWDYEELEKVFAVPIKELDSFHETLYFLWHKALPESDYDAIKDTAPILKAEIDSLMKVSLPYGCSVKKAEFEKRKSALKEAVYQLAEVCEKGSNQKIDEAVSLVHERFVELNRLLR